MFLARTSGDAETIQGNTHHARVRGPPKLAKDSKLPVLRKNAQKKDGVKIELQKIPLVMVEPGWLKSTYGNPYRSMQYIADWVEGETEIGVGEGGGMGDGVAEGDGEEAEGGAEGADD